MLWLLITCVIANTETQTFWGEKEYTILEPTEGDFSYLGIIVYAEKIQIEVDVTNDEANNAVDRQEYDLATENESAANA